MWPKNRPGFHFFVIEWEPRCEGWSLKCVQAPLVTFPDKSQRTRTNPNNFFFSLQRCILTILYNFGPDKPRQTPRNPQFLKHEMVAKWWSKLPECKTLAVGFHSPFPFFSFLIFAGFSENESYLRGFIVRSHHSLYWIPEKPQAWTANHKTRKPPQKEAFWMPRLHECPIWSRHSRIRNDDKVFYFIDQSHCASPIWTWGITILTFSL